MNAVHRIRLGLGARRIVDARTNQALKNDFVEQAGGPRRPEKAGVQVGAL
jgi:hypothetical protein